MKILHVLDHSVPLHSGYTFRTLAILQQQRRRGWETVQLTSPKQGLCAAPIEEVDGFAFHRTASSGRWLGNVPGLWPLDQIDTVTQRLYEIAVAERPDVLHAHSPVLNAWPAIRVGRRLGIPVVYEVRAFWEDGAVDLGTQREGGLRYRASRMLETAAFRRVDAITTICEGLRSDIVARGIAPDRVTLVPNAVDVERFPMLSGKDPVLLDHLGLGGREVVGFCGSFYSYEGLDLLVRAMTEIRRRRPAAALLLVGGGNEADALGNLVASLGLDSDVVFTGRVPNAQIDRYYSLIDVLAFPRKPMRLTELVTPLKPLEAMAQGRAVVASDVGGHRELIRDRETGLLFRAGDLSGLARAVIELLEHPELRDRIISAGREFVERERNWAASVARYAPVYERLARKMV